MSAGKDPLMDAWATNEVLPDSKILKTSQVNRSEDSTDGITGSVDSGGKPLLEVEFGPNFRIDRNLWITVLPIMQQTVGGHV